MVPTPNRNFLNQFLRVNRWVTNTTHSQTTPHERKTPYHSAFIRRVWCVLDHGPTTVLGSNAVDKHSRATSGQTNTNVTTGGVAIPTFKTPASGRPHSLCVCVNGWVGVKLAHKSDFFLLYRGHKCDSCVCSVLKLYPKTVIWS